MWSKNSKFFVQSENENFRLEIPFLGKFGPKVKNYQFKLKFSTYTNLNMKNSM